MTRQPASYIWGPINAEDLMTLPGTDWVITSGMIGPGAPLGRLYAVHRHDRSCSEVLPYRLDFALDEARFGGQDTPDAARFEPHGIDIRLRADGVAELFLVNHGERESVEVFEVLLDDARPSLRWIGGVTMPGTTLGNDVAALAGGGFVVSTTGDIDGKETAWEAGLAGDDTGGVLEWSPGAGWHELPGTQINVANGVAASPDGEWVYVAGWNGRAVKKVRRGPASPEVQVAAMPIMVDNLTWTDDGALLAAGAFDCTMQQFIDGHFSGEPRLAMPSRILRIDPDTLAYEIVVEYGTDTFGAATTGLQVGNEIWVGAARDHGLACFASRLTG